MAQFWASRSRLHKVVVVLAWIIAVAAFRALLMHDGWVGAFGGATLMCVCIFAVNAVIVRRRTPAEERGPIGLTWDEHPDAAADEPASGR